MTSEPLLAFAIIGCYSILATEFKMLRGEDENCTVEYVPWQEDLEYPGTNPRLRYLVRQNWEMYYACLMMRKDQERRPEIRRLIEGQYTELECGICPRPFEDYAELEWKYKPLSPDSEITELQHLDLTPEMTFTENKTIRIFNAVENFSGLYVCYHKLNVVSVYILEVSRNDTIQKAETFRSKQVVTSQRRHFEVSYRWSEWTECNACGRVGKKYKYGTCYVSPKQKTLVRKKKEAHKPRVCKWARYNTTNSSRLWTRCKIKSLRKTNHKKITTSNGTAQKNATCSPDNLEIMDKFSTGIPCASKYLPRSIFGQVESLPSIKVVVKFCWEPCRETEIFEVFDGTGRLVEWANNTAGIYSLFQDIPQLPRDIERRTVTAAFGDDITIHCPGTSLTNTPVVWKLNNQIIFPDLIANESNGRFTIDWINRIVLRKLRLKDSRIYSCWEKDKLVGTVHLNVEKKFKVRLDHHIVLVGAAAVVGTLLFLGSKIIAREIKLRA